MKALEGIKVLDFTHVQSGPTCTQILGWFGADVIKVERPGVGDATRKQLIDVAGADSLYFTMLNHNKRSIELNSKNETGKEVLTRLIEECDVLVENFAPGALDRMGFSWERIQEINPRIIMASIKGFGPGKPQVTERQVAGNTAMASTSQLDQAIAHFEQAMRQLEAAWAQSEQNQGKIAKLNTEASALKNDRAKLASELDEVRARAQEWTEASRQAARRIELAMARVRTVIGEEA